MNSVNRSYSLVENLVLSLLGVVLLSLSACAQNTPDTVEKVTIARVPNGGLQPRVVVRDKVVHLTYFKGDPRAGDIFYTRSNDDGSTWAPALRVNSQPKSAIAMGTIRGATLAVGRAGHVFVAWNGSDEAQPRNTATPTALRAYGASPLLFSRLNAISQAFETQRNLLKRTFNLDGGACVAADEEGRVYLTWHANDKETQDESGRRVFLTTSTDDGATFSPERPVWDVPTGVCGCCQIAIEAKNGGLVQILYRSATENVHRDSYFLQSTNSGKSFRGQKLHEWNINACPMSSYALTNRGETAIVGWESAGQVYFSPLDSEGSPIQITAAPESGTNRKYPALAVGNDGQILFAWTEGTSWNKGGSLRFQLFDAQNKPQGVTQRKDGVPAWSFATAFTRSDGNFTILY